MRWLLTKNPSLESWHGASDEEFLPNFVEFPSSEPPSLGSTWHRTHKTRKNVRGFRVDHGLVLTYQSSCALFCHIEIQFGSNFAAKNAFLRSRFRFCEPSFTFELHCAASGNRTMTEQMVFAAAGRCRTLSSVCWPIHQPHGEAPVMSTQLPSWYVEQLCVLASRAKSRGPP